ncbi:hypothetical protein K438DRAFT_2003517 [Mycena galopus ATCC 62051]|nr:hypothetical protein K438DRAFT_2003517 [Mycena galopus ATCC 62051]
MYYWLLSCPDVDGYTGHTRPRLASGSPRCLVVLYAYDSRSGRPHRGLTIQKFRCLPRSLLRAFLFLECVSFAARTPSTGAKLETQSPCESHLFRHPRPSPSLVALTWNNLRAPPSPTHVPIVQRPAFIHALRRAGCDPPPGRRVVADRSHAVNDVAAELTPSSVVLADLPSRSRPRVSPVADRRATPRRPDVAVPHLSPSSVADAPTEQERATALLEGRSVSSSKKCAPHTAIRVDDRLRCSCIARRTPHVASLLKPHQTLCVGSPCRVFATDSPASCVCCANERSRCALRRCKRVRRRPSSCSSDAAAPLATSLRMSI